MTKERDTKPTSDPKLLAERLRDARDRIWKAKDETGEGSVRFDTVEIGEATAIICEVANELAALEASDSKVRLAEPKRRKAKTFDEQLEQARMEIEDANHAYPELRPQP